MAPRGDKTLNLRALSSALAEEFFDLGHNFGTFAFDLYRFIPLNLP